jgi:hypothetical protein
MFPIADLTGRTIAFGGRVVGDGRPKYLNSAETPLFHKSSNLYAIERAKNEIVRSGIAIVVEGYTDVIALHEADSLPELKYVVGSNRCHIGWVADNRTGNIVVISALDNLIKGAAGQGIQNMNLMMGIDETTGLNAPAWYL